MTDHEKRGWVAWMARNPVASNVLMALLLIGGVITAFRIKQEVFPEFEIEMITVNIAYPGASPEEIEDGIVIPVEEAVRDIDGVEEIRGTASEGAGTVTLEFETGIDTSRALTDVKNAVDGLKTLPDEAERARVSLLSHRRHIIDVVIFGDLKEDALRALAERAQEDLLNIDEVASISIEGIRPRVVSIEVPRARLEEYGLTLAGIASMVRARSSDIGAGGVDAESGEVLLRVKERKDKGSEFTTVPVATSADGSEVTLADIATVIDGYDDSVRFNYYNGKRAVRISVYSDGDQTPMEAAEAVQRYVSEFREFVPAGVEVETFNDRARVYGERVDLLLRNAYLGLILVIVLLGLFLDLKLAFWVTMGIPVSFLGALLLLPLFGVTINMISLMAFIMTLGMVVDDAIVVGENIYSHRQKGLPFVKAAILATREVAVPVTFAIATNIAAFLPLLFVEGIMGKIFRVVPIVVCLAFLISLTEALYILPAHLGHSRPWGEGIFGAVRRKQQALAEWIERKIKGLYTPVLEFALAHHYFIVAAGVSMLLIVAAYVASGRLKLTFAPGMEGDEVEASIELQYGVPVEDTIAVQDKVVKAVYRAIEQVGERDDIIGVYTSVGSSSGRRHFSSGGSSSHAAHVSVYIVGANEREFQPSELAAAWRKEVGPIPGMEKMTFGAREFGPPGGDAVHFNLSHNDAEILEAAAKDLAKELEGFPNVKDIDDGLTRGKPQLDFKVKPEAAAMGLTAADIGAQLRNAFYGAEVTRFMRGRDEVKVMVRLPEKERNRVLTVEDMLLTAPIGGTIPLREAAEVVHGYAYTLIQREDTRRITAVKADVQPRSAAVEISAEAEATTLRDLQRKYPGLVYSLGGREEERLKSMQSLYAGFAFALIAIFGMLAVVFRSYIQPLVVMTAIPFGIIGAVIGHLILGYNLSLMSMMGIVALSGVVVNDSLVMIDFANNRRKEGMKAREAIRSAGIQRLRPILLTTLTTFFGLTPMLLETSPHVRMLVPMAISLGFGVLFSTMILLLIVPSLYLIVEDVKGFLGIRSVPAAGVG